jgi:hypothetical protein
MLSRNWDCLDKSGWSLRMMWVSVRESVWDELCADLPLPYKSSWRIWWIVSFLCLFILQPSESFDDLVSPFHDICDCVCISRGWRTPASWIILKILTPVFKLNAMLWLKTSSP